MRGEVLAAPLPFVDIRSLAARDPVQRAVEREGDLILAGLGLARAAVVAPAGLVADDAHHQRHIGHDHGLEQVLAQLVGQQAALQLPDPRRIDQRLGAVGQHEAVPAAHQLVHPGGAGVARRALQQERQHVGGVAGEIVGLHDDHAVDRMALDLAQQLVGAELAVGLAPVAGDEVAVVVGHHACVGVDDDAARRIVDPRQLVERHEARPVEVRRSSRAPASSRRPCAGSARAPATPGRCSPRCRHRPCSAWARRSCAPRSGSLPSSAPARCGRSPRPRCRCRRARWPAAPARGPAA